jgi:hypothetical protein
MEMLMYSRGYGKKIQELIWKRFEQIPVEIRSRITGADYSGVEKICPQKMQIARFMKEAYFELGRNGVGPR